MSVSNTIRAVLALIIALWLFGYVKKSKAEIDRNLVLKTCERLVLLQEDLGRELWFLTNELRNGPVLKDSPEVNRITNVNDLIFKLDIWYRRNCEVDPNTSIK